MKSKEKVKTKPGTSRVSGLTDSQPREVTQGSTCLSVAAHPLARDARLADGHAADTRGAKDGADVGVTLLVTETAITWMQIAVTLIESLAKVLTEFAESTCKCRMDKSHQNKREKQKLS